MPFRTNSRIYSQLCDRARFEMKSSKKLQDRRPTMNPNTFINALFLFLVNVAFMVAGIFLNVVVIISLWRSFNNFEINCATL
jgi:hypothetical protein